MAGGFMAIGSCVSALTKNQVIAFVISVVVGLGFVLSGYPMVMDVFSGWAPPFFLELISSFSFLTHFNALSRGVIDVRDLVYFLSLIGVCCLPRHSCWNGRKPNEGSNPMNIRLLTGSGLAVAVVMFSR